LFNVIRPCLTLFDLYACTQVTLLNHEILNFDLVLQFNAKNMNQRISRHTQSKTRQKKEYRQNIFFVIFFFMNSDKHFYAQRVEFRRFLDAVKRKPSAVCGPLVFQMNEISYGTTRRQSDRWQSPIIRMFGTTENGSSVLVRVGNFEPYFYCDMPQSNIFANDVSMLPSATSAPCDGTTIETFDCSMYAEMLNNLSAQRQQDENVELEKTRKWASFDGAESGPASSYAQNNSTSATFRTDDTACC
jgi:hypothetical protein